MKNISELRKEYPELSLKKICETLGVCYQYVLKASKQPIPNEVYDPINTFNDAAVNKVLERKGVDITGGESTPIDWATIASECATARAASTGTSTSIEAFAPGTLFTLRNTREDAVYKAIYKSETHIVFVACDALTVATLENRHELVNTPRVMNFSTFLHQTPRLYGAPTKEEVH